MIKSLVFHTKTDVPAAKRTVYFLLLFPLLVACQTVEDTGNGAWTKNLAMVSHFDSSYTISAGKNTLAWKPGASFLRGSEKINPDTYKPLIKHAVEKALKHKGYKWSMNVEDSDLLVSYAAGLEAQLSDDEISQRFGMMPGLQGKSTQQGNYQKGAIIVDIFDKSTNRSVWRGVVQGYTDLNLSVADRGKRMEYIMRQLLAEFPAML